MHLSLGFVRKCISSSFQVGTLRNGIFSKHSFHPETVRFVTLEIVDRFLSNTITQDSTRRYFGIKRILEKDSNVQSKFRHSLGSKNVIIF